MSLPVIFVGGVHGAGKSFLCSNWASQLGARHATGGALIRASMDANDTVGVGIGEKVVLDVDTNQARLLIGLRHYREALADSAIACSGILLDGHFCLLVPDGSIAAIPTTVFEMISPVAAVLVEADAATVYNRLVRRDGEAPAPQVIAALAMAERARAKEVCASLGIPLSMISSMDPQAQTGGQELRLIRRYLDIEG